MNTGNVYGMSPNIQGYDPTIGQSSARTATVSSDQLPTLPQVESFQGNLPELVQKTKNWIKEAELKILADEKIQRLKMPEGYNKEQQEMWNTIVKLIRKKSDVFYKTHIAEAPMPASIVVYCHESDLALTVLEELQRRGAIFSTGHEYTGLDEPFEKPCICYDFTFFG